MTDHAPATGGLAHIGPHVRAAQEAARHRFLLGRAAHDALTPEEALIVVCPTPGSRLAPDMLRELAWQVLLAERGGWVDRARLRHERAVLRAKDALLAISPRSEFARFCHAWAVWDQACRRADGRDGPACEVAP